MTQEIQFTVYGDRVKAIYLETGVSKYDDNPLIEALPPILTNDEAISELSYYPFFDEKDRNAPKHLRYHIIQNGLKFFSALDINLDLERRISSMIRVGYTDRNPIKRGVWKKLEDRISQLTITSRNQYNLTKNYKSTAAIGFNIIGISGIGKTQTVENILRLYPQVINHNQYKQKKFTQTQIVWLKLECPFDGSIKGLCFNFFLSVDDILGTNYFKKYAEAKTVDQMLPNVARVASNHFIGVLVIDEIQRLSKARSGGEQKMLDFFVQLVNKIGVPIILIGTFKALPLLSGSLSQMRRGSGQGDVIWDRMEFDAQWQLLVEALWKYQYVHNPCNLKDSLKLSKVLYEESQGITDLAIKLFMFSQETAISSEQEEINSSVIRATAKNKFRLLQPVIKAFKNKEKEALKDFEDAYPAFLLDLIVTPLKPNQIVGAVCNEPEIKINLTSESQTNEEKGVKR